MLVREWWVDAKTGESGERWVDYPDMVAPADALARDAAVAAQESNERTIGSALDNALSAMLTFQTENATFLALGATPTAAQVRDHTRRLANHSTAYSRALVALIRLTRKRLESTEGAALKA